jgi:hypothetical protein
MKQNLQEVTDYKVMNVKECFDALNWSYEDNGESYDNISCDCGGELEFPVCNGENKSTMCLPHF